MNAWINHIQRFCTHDGPGIRTTVFFQGCNLACRWCHNPDAIFREPVFRYTEGKCRSCGACAQACPNGALAWGLRPKWSADKCVRCGTCERACLTGAASLSAKAMTIEEVLSAVLRDQPFYAASGGGLTCSGGEPMLTRPFLERLLHLAKERGVHTAVDTAACVPWAWFEAVLPVTDLFLVDYKLEDAVRHRAFTSADNGLMKDNLRRLVHRCVPVEVRIPIVPTVNDCESVLSAMSEYLRDIAFTGGVRLLTYHRLGEHKYRALGMEPPLGNLQPPEDAQLQRCRQVFERAGLTVMQA